MKLLFDENLAPSLVQVLAEASNPESTYLVIL